MRKLSIWFAMLLTLVVIWGFVIDTKANSRDNPYHSMIICANGLKLESCSTIVTPFYAPKPRTDIGKIQGPANAYLGPNGEVNVKIWYYFNTPGSSFNCEISFVNARVGSSSRLKMRQKFGDISATHYNIQNHEHIFCFDPVASTDGKAIYGNKHYYVITISQSWGNLIELEGVLSEMQLVRIRTSTKYEISAAKDRRDRARNAPPPVLDPACQASCIAENCSGINSILLSPSAGPSSNRRAQLRYMCVEMICRPTCLR